ncbi:MAG: polysaccharide deacetylase family protein [Deltaproteobacteria bacterium]|nr:polysaccharide deacetylase family protein [Deltaproteobacteria bacterium]
MKDLPNQSLLVKRCKGLIWNLAYISGLLHLLERIKRKPEFKGFIFFYHRIHPDPKGDFLNLSIPPSLFQRQLNFLKKKGIFVSLEEFLFSSKRAHSSSLSIPQIVLTFDDGYQDVFEYAWPIMRSNGIFPTFFICTDPLFRGIPLLWDFLAKAVQDDPREELQLKNPSGLSSCYSLRTPSDKINTVGRLNQILFGYERQELKKVLADLFPAFKRNNRGDEERLYLGPEQVRTAFKEGIQIGAHTASHPCLPEIPKEGWEKEVLDSKKELESLLDREVPFFAYPAGEFNSEVRNYIEHIGFRAALTTGKRPVFSDTQDLYTVPRICPAFVISRGKFYALVSGVKPEWFVP